MQLRVLKQPLTGAYLSFFLMLTLMIMVGATWIGLYLAKRITRPVQMLSAAAREIGAGHLDRRLEPETADEFGSLVEAFNSMAGELAASRQKLEQSTYDLQRKHRRGRRAAPVHRNGARADRDRRDLGGCRRPGHHDQRVGRAAARARSRRRRPPGARRARPARSRTAARPAAEGPARPRRAAGAGDRADARGSRGPPGRRRERAARRVGGGRRRRARVRRRDAAHPVAEGGGVARGGAAPRARDQEPADADPALGRAAAPPLRRRRRRPPRRWSPSAPAPSSGRSSRSRGWSTSSRSSRACRRRAPCRRISTRCSTTR